MYPHDIEQQSLEMPSGDRHSAVLVTGGCLRHLQFGYQLQKRFPGMVKKWLFFSVSPPKPPQPILKRVLEMLKRVRIRNGIRVAPLVCHKIKSRLRDRSLERAQNDAEVRMFSEQVQSLKRQAECHPTLIGNIHGQAVIDEILNIDPYFLLSLGGGLLQPRLINSVRGLAINQHSGWSPEYKGSHTPHQALYHRELVKVGNTVHLLASGADSGPILRRSSVKVHEGDSLDDVFMAAIALGTELLFEVLTEALEVDSLPVFHQPHIGETFLSQDLNPYRLKCIERDLDNDFLRNAIAEDQNW